MKDVLTGDAKSVNKVIHFLMGSHRGIDFGAYHTADMNSRKSDSSTCGMYQDRLETQSVLRISGHQGLS